MGRATLVITGFLTDVPDDDDPENETDMWWTQYVSGDKADAAALVVAAMKEDKELKEILEAAVTLYDQLSPDIGIKKGPPIPP